ncbi:MAG: hypothetical protein Q8M31_01730 [Beijerinckiaceae bacterium]|nr:hypothetical protein [Beijerinckiaceae bacterium]
MFALTKSGVLKCVHGGVVKNENSQDWVRIDGDPLLVEGDLLGRSISRCPMTTITTPPCTSTVTVDDVSYSTFIMIDGRRICLDRASGCTNWSQLNVTPFSVTDVAQNYVQSGA